jgi:hypothetical protein
MSNEDPQTLQQITYTEKKEKNPHPLAIPARDIYYTTQQERTAIRENRLKPSLN